MINSYKNLYITTGIPKYKTVTLQPLFMFLKFKFHVIHFLRIPGAYSCHTPSQTLFNILHKLTQTQREKLIFSESNIYFYIHVYIQTKIGIKKDIYVIYFTVSKQNIKNGSIQLENINILFTYYECTKYPILLFISARYNIKYDCLT